MYHTILIMVSFASDPELVKKTRVRFSGVISTIFSARRTEGSCDLWLKVW